MMLLRNFYTRVCTKSIQNGLCATVVQFTLIPIILIEFIQQNYAQYRLSGTYGRSEATACALVCTFRPVL